MSSITIHALDAELDIKLTEAARREKKSKNQLVKDLLALSLGIKVAGFFSNDYQEFCGLWTASEKEAFDKTQLDNQVVESAEWM